MRGMLPGGGIEGEGEGGNGSVCLGGCVVRFF